MSRDSDVAGSIIALENSLVHIEAVLREELGGKKRLPLWYRGLVQEVLDIGNIVFPECGELAGWREHHYSALSESRETYAARTIMNS